MNGQAPEVENLSPIVNTDSGPVQGIKKVTVFGDEYLSFQRIPYAQPPVGQLRFKSPVPVQPWTDVLDATKQGASCSQNNFLMGMVVGEENCLFLNVFTKDIKPSKPLPVMVYIHGGGFMVGSSGTEVYGPDYLLQKDVIMVSLNYRLGVFGFLSLKDQAAEVPGNAGLKDQSMAMKWVKKNIHHFGGDPKNITLFGESAGACSVHYHMVSNHSKNLFNRAIVMSGTTLNGFAVLPDRNLPRRLAKNLGWNPEEHGDSDKNVVDFLQQQDHLKLAAEQDNLYTIEERKEGVGFPFGPVIEPYVGKDCFVPTHPRNLCRRAWSRSLPCMIGGCSEEGLFFYKETLAKPFILESLREDFVRALPHDLQHHGERTKQKMAEQVKKLYFQNHEPSADTIDNYIMLVTDKLFWHGVHRTILSRMNSLERGPTYVYRFNFDSEYFNHIRNILAGPGVRGSSHADELSYLFKNDFPPPKFPEEGSKEYIMIQTMVDLWTTFAITSNPNNPNSPYIKHIKWTPVSNSIKDTPYHCLNISDKLEIKELPETSRMKMWDSMYENDQLY